MYDFIVFSLLSFGVTAFIVDSSLLQPFRNRLEKYEELSYSKSSWWVQIMAKISMGASCYQCIGFHVGWILHLCGQSPLGNVVISAFVSSATCTIIANVIFREVKDDINING